MDLLQVNHVSPSSNPSARSSKGQHVRNRVTTDSAVSILSGIGLFVSRVNGLKSRQTLAKSRGQSFIRLRLVDEKSVAASIRDVESVQECCSRGLVLIRDVAVPGD